MRSWREQLLVSCGCCSRLQLEGAVIANCHRGPSVAAGDCRCWPASPSFHRLLEPQLIINAQ